jgi:hypothetical protein
MPETPAEWLHPRPLATLNGSECLTPDGATVGDFWRWAFSDLRSNATRGILAEYLVARAVKAKLDRSRVEWDNFDVLSPSGVRIEVKSAAYLQSWPQARPSQIRYAGLTGRAWSPEANTYSQQPEIRCDVFVFALQTCRAPEAYDPLSLGQWEFRVVDAPQVWRWNAHSIGLSTLTRAGIGPVTWHQLADHITVSATMSSAAVADGRSRPS